MKKILFIIVLHCFLFSLTGCFSSGSTDLSFVVGNYVYSTSKVMGGYEISARLNLRITKETDGNYYYKVEKTVTDKMYGGIPKTETSTGKFATHLDNNNDWYLLNYGTEHISIPYDGFKQPPAEITMYGDGDPKQFIRLYSSSYNSPQTSQSNSTDESNTKIFKNIVGDYYGESIMGYSVGEAQISITASGKIGISYDHGELGSATEYGKLSVSSNPTNDSARHFKFVRDAGGEYDVAIKIASNQTTIVLTGLNWRVTASKNTSTVNSIDTTNSVDTTSRNENDSNTEMGSVGEIPEIKIDLDSALKLGLAAFYPLKGNTKDNSINQYDGKGVNISTTSDRFNRNASAYYFSGKQSFIDCGNHDNLKIYDEITMGAWFTINKDCSGGRILSTEDPEGNYRITASDINGNQKSINCSFGNVTLSTIVDTDKWYHILFTYKSGVEVLYLNDERVSQANNAETQKFNYSGDFVIGRKAAPNYDCWIGAINDVFVYNRALNDEEVSKLYQVH